MINTQTPYKLAEIIRDTWPQIYYKNKCDEKNKNARKNYIERTN